MKEILINQLPLVIDPKYSYMEDRIYDIVGPARTPEAIAEKLMNYWLETGQYILDVIINNNKYQTIVRGSAESSDYDAIVKLNNKTILSKTITFEPI